MYADDQVEELMMMTNVPARVIEAAKEFPQYVQNMEKSKAQTMIGGWRAADRAKATAASQQVAEDHRRLDELNDLVESGKRSSSSVMDEVMNIESRLRDAQRRHTALENSEARYSAIEADPCDYFDEFYTKYSGLRDRRMNLRDYLAEQGLSR